MARSITELFLNALRDEQTVRTKALVNNPAKTFDDYRHQCGIVEGLAEAQEILLNLVQGDDENG